MISKLYRTW